MPKPIDTRIADLKAKKEKLAERLNTLQAKAKTIDRKRDTRRKIIIGGAVLAALEKDPFIRDTVRRFLVNNVTRPKDRDAIADLLATPAKAPVQPPAPPKAPAPVSTTGASWMQNLPASKERG